MLRQVDYVIVMVSDMARSIEFYRDKLGLALKFESKEWTEFQTGSTTLALHGGGIRRENAQENSEASPAGTCSIGFAVEDLDRTYEELKSKGAHFVLPPSRREEEGIRLAVCLDPDGLPISFSGRM
ncbi:MAG: VOC family protein [Acidobacteriota bacterium]